MRPGPRRAVLLRHRDPRGWHLDLILEGGARCPTLGIHGRGRRRRAGWLAPHRPRYLRYQGPIAGRGACDRLWAGRLQLGRSAGTWHFRLPICHLILGPDGMLVLGPGAETIR